MRADRATRIVLVGGVALLLCQCATADAGVKVWGYSKQNGSGEAEVGGGVSDGDSSPPSSGSSGGSGTPGVSYTPPSAGGTGTPPTYDASAPPVTGGETVSFDPNFRGAMARPPGFAPGTACLYFPEAPGACPVTSAPPETLRGRRGRARAAPPIDPYAVAESIARSMPLLPGEVRTDPAGRGWAGVTTWFWLEPAPRTIAAVAVLGAERIVVTAVPSPAWNFGDGAAPKYGTGRPYERGDGAGEGAVAHRYETRCLPGDRGRNPYVLDSCSVGGYRVEASVNWSISFVATGPVPGAGALPSRTTTATSTYAVNEVRAFLSSDREGGGPS